MFFCLVSSFELIILQEDVKVGHGIVSHYQNHLYYLAVADLIYDLSWEVSGYNNTYLI
jgi:hypothetical protein